MHADFSVELGRDDAALELPWNSTDPAVRYYDLKNHPELLQQIPEAMAYPELGAFLARINATGFPLATAKCDAWRSREVAPEEEIFGDRKFVSYIDLVFEREAERCSIEKHEAFAKDLCRLLGQAPEIPAAVEVVIRRCYYHGEGHLLEAADDAVAGDGDEVEKKFKAENGTEAKDAAGAGEAADAGDGVERGGAEVSDADGAGEAAGAREWVDAGHRVEARGAEVSDADDAGEAAGAREWVDAGHRVETRGATEVTDAADAGEAAGAREWVDAGHRVETKGATEVNDATEAKDVEERQSGVTNREGVGRVAASERTEQQADVGHGMKYEGHADAGQRAEANIDEGEAAERLDKTTDERVGPSSRDGSVNGFCFTAYVTGFGDSDHEPRLRWQIALALLQNALVQLARN
jgi:hypothetical protein